MVHLITIDGEGHKVGRPITNKEQYFEARNTAENRKNFEAARGGDNHAKLRLVQFNYNDQLPDGTLAGCCTVASTFCHDIDIGEKEECKKVADRILEMKEQLGLLELGLSPNWGVHAVCRRQLGKTILENQIAFSLLTKTEMDCNAHDQQRIFFTGPTEKTLLYLDESIFDEPLTVEQGKEEYLRLKEREEKGEEELPANYKKGEKHYRPWEQTCEVVTPVATQPVASNEKSEKEEVQDADEIMLFDHPVIDYINTLLPEGVAKGQRHQTMLKLANDFVILLDNNEQLVKQALLQASWVRDVVKERKEKELNNVIDSAQKLLKKREQEYISPPQPSKNMRRAIETLTGKSYRSLVREMSKQMIGQMNEVSENDVLHFLNRLGGEIKKLMPRYPLLEQLCHGLKPKHYIAALFIGGAYGMTLMTRCWYRYWPAPGRKCHMNCILELIGRMGSGKHILVDLYRIMMEPVKIDDQSQIDALNKWNQEHDQKNGSSKNSTVRPTGIFRCLPCDSSAAAIRDAMFNNFEEIDGEKVPLHVSITDSELDNTLTQMKKEYMNISSLHLKAFHNEPQGAFLKTTTANVGEIDIYANFMYSGTEYALAKQVTPDNYGSGLPTRLTVVPMGDSNFEMMENRKYTAEDVRRDELIKHWSYKLNKTRSEIPCEDISNALYQWTARRMEDAKENNSKAEEDLLKRVGWHAMNYSLPFIVSRHWDQMVYDDKGYWLCGENFCTDKYDRQLALLIAKAQLAFQHYFFKAIAEQYYEKMDAKQLSGKNYQGHTALAYSRLPSIFTTEDVDKQYGYEGNNNSIYSCLKRLKDDGRAQRIRAGENKGKYRKLE